MHSIFQGIPYIFSLSCACYTKQKVSFIEVRQLPCLISLHFLMLDEVLLHDKCVFSPWGNVTHKAHGTPF